MSDTFYYSADGDRISLRSSPDTLAIAYRSEVPPKDLESLIRGDDQLAQFTTSGELENRRIILYKRNSNARISLETFIDRLSSNVAIQYVHPVYYQNDSPLIVTDEFIAAFKPEVERRVIDELNAVNNVEILSEFTFVSNVFLLKVQSSNVRGTLEVANHYFETGITRYSEPNFVRSISFELAFNPNDPLFPQQWHLPRVQAPDAWDITRGDRSVTIAVLDDGVDVDHEDFASPGKIVAGRDVLSGDDDPRPARPGDVHGTSVAGVATADGNNNLGVTGVAPGSRLMAIRLINTSTPVTEVEAFRFATDRGASIINNSWKPLVPSSFPGIVRDIFEYATNTGRGGRGCVIFFCTHNDTGLVATNNGYATSNRVIAVAASNDSDVRSSYSNFGPEVSICAPSNDGVPGHLGITTTNWRGNPNAPTNYISNFGGTSSACPLAAGIAALMLSINPNLTWQQVKYILEATADKIDTTNTNAIAQYQASGHSQWYGYGRVNAFEAVKSARSSVPERDFVQRTFVTLRRTTGDRFVSTQVVHAIDARQRKADTPSDIFVRGGPDGFLHLQLGADLVNQFAEVDVD